MATSASLVTATNTLKRLYSSKDFVDATYAGLPLWEMIPKRGDYSGNGVYESAPHEVGNQAGVAANYAAANNGTAPNTYKSFNITPGKIYGVGRIEGDLVRMSKTNATRFVDSLKKEQGGLITRTKNLMSALLWGNGGGAIGQIKAGSVVNTTTLYLEKFANFRFFNIGSKLRVSSTDGSTAGDVLRAGELTVTGVNPRNGTITCAETLNVGIAAIAAGDYVFMKGTFGQDDPLVTGVGGWIPQTDPSATPFLGVNRAVYPHGLAGQRYLDGTGGAIEDVFIDFCAYLAEVGSEPSHAFIHPSKFGALAKALANKVHIDDKSEASIGYKRIRVATPTGVIDVVSDPGCPTTGIYALNPEVWCFHHCGELFDYIPFDDNGSVFVKEHDADRYKWEVLAFGLLECQEPKHNGFALL